MTGIDRDVENSPGFHLALRPGATVYSLRGQDTYVPIANASGGERFWVLGLIPLMPLPLGGGIGYLGDVTSDGGLNYRSVIAKRSDLIGRA